MGKLRKLLLLLLLLPLLIAAGHRPETGGNAVILDDGWTGTFWGDANDALYDDGDYGIVGTSGRRADFGQWSRVEVPQNARIHGIEVCIEAKVEDTCTANDPDISVLISQDGGTSYSVFKETADLTDAAFQTVCVGDSGERWQKLGFLGTNASYDWRPEHFNNESSFAVRLQPTWKTPVACGMGHGMSINVEYLYARIYYTVADDPILHQKLRTWRH